MIFVVGWLTHFAGHAVRQVVLGGGPWGKRGGPSFFPPADVVAGVRTGA